MGHRECRPFVPLGPLSRPHEPCGHTTCQINDKWRTLKVISLLARPLRVRRFVRFSSVTEDNRGTEIVFNSYGKALSFA